MSNIKGSENSSLEIRDHLGSVREMQRVSLWESPHCESGVTPVPGPRISLSNASIASNVFFRGPDTYEYHIFGGLPEPERSPLSFFTLVLVYLFAVHGLAPAIILARSCLNVGKLEMNSI